MTLVTAGSPGFRAGKSPAFLVLRGSAQPGAVPDEEARREDLEQERGEGKVSMVRRETVTVSVVVTRAAGS